MKSSRNRNREAQFQNDIFKTCKEFGGSLHGKGNAKTARPLSTKHAMHVVLRSSLAKGDWSLRNVKKKLKDMKSVIADRFKAKRCPSGKSTNAQSYDSSSTQAYCLLNTLSSSPSSIHTYSPAGESSSRAASAEMPDKFWDFRPWSRIVEWGKAYRSAKTYVFQNELEADGIIPFTERKEKAAESIGKRSSSFSRLSA